MNQPTTNRTFVCSVLFLDIVGYSKRSVVEQMTLKQRFNTLLGDALRHVATDDRIVLDTGDGAAVSFLANPEDSLFAALALRNAIAADPEDAAMPLLIRMGINLGPVRLIKDINGHTNIIGDGINAAQRVMSFAEPGTILVSRSFHEVVSCLSDDIARMFSYGGTRKDKHVRKHALFAVAPTARSANDGKANSAAADAADQPSAPPSRRFRPSSRAVGAIASIVVIALLAYVGMQAMRPPPPTSPEIVVEFAIAPWGEVHVDGQTKGVSPPLKSVTLPRGAHRIEIRNGDLPAYVLAIDNDSEPRLTLQHKF